MRNIFVDPTTLARSMSQIFERRREGDAYYIDIHYFDEVRNSAGPHENHLLTTVVQSGWLKVRADIGRKARDLLRARSIAGLNDQESLVVGSFFTFERAIPDLIFLSDNLNPINVLSSFGVTTMHFQPDGYVISTPVVPHAEPPKSVWSALLWLLVGASLSAGGMFAWEKREFILESWSTWGLVACVVFALGLFFLRCRARWVYALIEIGFGVYSISKTATGFDLTTSDLSQLVPIIASVYIVVRGLDNYDQGWKPRMIDEFWNLIFRRRPLSNEMKQRIAKGLELVWRNLPRVLLKLVSKG